jgi:hypothetical protein
MLTIPVIPVISLLLGKDNFISHYVFKKLSNDHSFTGMAQDIPFTTCFHGK